MLQNKRKVKIKSVTVDHGTIKSNCFIIDNKLAYISDVSKIYKKDYKYFKNLKYLITDVNGKILKNSFNLENLLKNTNWKKL